MFFKILSYFLLGIFTTFLLLIYNKLARIVTTDHLNDSDASSTVYMGIVINTLAWPIFTPIVVIVIVYYKLRHCKGRILRIIFPH